MVAAFKFTNEHTSSEVRNIIDLLREPRLLIPTEKDYPTHAMWLEKVATQIKSGEKRAMVAYSHARPVGVVIYQQSEGRPRILEVKNISVTPEFRSKGIATFALRLAEIEAMTNDFPGVTEASIDTKTSNTKMIHFLMAQGYEIKEITDLYGLGAGVDAVLTKSIATEKIDGSGH